MNKTWFIDIDGTLVKHLDESEIEKGGREELVPYAVEFMAGIQKRGDTVVLTTARPEEFRSITERMLKDFGIEWSDVHANNIMERPGTRDLVLIDVGFFA